MTKVRLHVEFNDGSTDSAIGTGLTLDEGMLIIDFGPNNGQAGFAVHAIKTWYTEAVEV